MRNPLLLAILALASCGVFGPSTEKKKQIYNHQSNAQTYWDGKQYAQALDQVRRGLEIEPNDYKLNLIRANCLLRQAEAVNDPAMLEKAAEAFDRVLTLRASGALEPKAWLGYAQVQQALSLAQLRDAERARQDLDRATLSDLEKEERKARAREHDAKAASHGKNAERALNRLIEGQELQRLAHNHLMLILGQRKDYAAAITHGNKCLELSEKEQAQHNAEIERTPVAGYESHQRMLLRELVEEEIDVRAFVANLHWKLAEHKAAVAQLTRVLNLDPSRSIDYYNRARSYRALGNADDAKNDFKKFLATTKLPPGSTQVSDAYASLKQP